MDKLQSDNKSLRKTIVELTAKVTRLEAQARRTSGPIQSNVFGVDSARSSLPSNKKRTSTQENETAAFPPAGTHRKDNDTSVTTIEHPIEMDDHSSSEGEAEQDEDENKPKEKKKNRR